MSNVCSFNSITVLFRSLDSHSSPSSSASFEQPPFHQPTMLPEHWVPPCGNRCTRKYAALTQLPWRVFCKKGCNSDEETYEECLEDCNQLCYKDPVIEGQQWSAYIDRSPGAASYSEECFHACASGCGFKFDIKEEEVAKACPNRPSYSPPDQKPGLQQPAKQSTAKPGSSA